MYLLKYFGIKPEVLQLVTSRSHGKRETSKKFLRLYKQGDISVRLSVRRDIRIVTTLQLSNSFIKNNTSDSLKGRVQCFSMQVVMNKYFLLNL